MNIGEYDENECRMTRQIIITEMTDRRYFFLGIQVLFTSIFGYMTFISKNSNYFMIYVLIQYVLSLVDFGFFLDSITDILSLNKQIECYAECRIIQEILNSQKINDVINRISSPTDYVIVQNN